MRRVIPTTLTSDSPGPSGSVIENAPPADTAAPALRVSCRPEKYSPDSMKPVLAFGAGSATSLR